MRGVALHQIADDILAGQVRALQETFEPRAHAAMLQWGSWSRVNPDPDGPLGARPQVTRPKIYRDVLTEQRRSDPMPYFVMDYCLPTKRCMDKHVVGDPDDSDNHADLLLGEQVDTIIHVAAFVEDWRRVVRAVYVDKLPPHQWAKAARVREHRFVEELGRALRFVSERLL